jgi:hypothetical protein
MIVSEEYIEFQNSTAIQEYGFSIEGFQDTFSIDDFNNLDELEDLFYQYLYDSEFKEDEILYREKDYVSDRDRYFENFLTYEGY